MSSNSQFADESSQESYEFVEELASAQQTINVIELEKIEYETEMNNLQKQNEKLLEENKSFHEIIQTKQEQMSLLISVAKNADLIGSENDDLNVKLSEYEQVIKKLKWDKETLSKENEKYKNILEEMNEKQQKQDITHSNNIINLENKINELQNEYNQLNDKLNANKPNLFHPAYSNEEQYKSPIKSNRGSCHNLFRFKTMQSTTPFMSHFMTLSISESTTPIITDNGLSIEVNEYEEEINIDCVQDITPSPSHYQIKSERKRNYEMKLAKQRSSTFNCLGMKSWFG